MHEDIQKAGANARALGKTFLDNPYYASDKTPRATGESLETWTAKANAWAFGWRMEDLMRPRDDSASALLRAVTRR